MGGNGFPRRPTALENFLGNPRKQKKSLAEKEPQPLEIPPSEMNPPDELSNGAKEVWFQYAGKLVACGLLTQIDLPEFERYCETVSAWRMARADLKERGPLIKTFYVKGARVGELKSSFPNPSLRVMRDLGNEMNRLAQSFGMTPSARTRIEVDTPPLAPGQNAHQPVAGSVSPEAKDKDDPFAVPH